jgi:3-hydroxymyristoyl/3-hydroxydecanoyl-(acyl carrier protein) dehydratase
MAVAVSQVQTVAQKLGAAMQERGMTQAELAQLLAEPGDPQTKIDSIRRLLNKWLTNRVKPGRRYATKLATIFDKHPDYFVDTQLPAVAAAKPSPRSGEREATALRLVVDADGARTWSKIKDTFDRKFIAEELSDGFAEDHVLIDEIVEWREFEYARGKAHLDATTLDLGPWYTNSTLMPGMVVLELLAQVSSVAMLTNPAFRKRTIQIAGFDEPRFTKIVTAGSTLEVTATLMNNHLRFAYYEADAHILDENGQPGETVAHAIVICVC